MEKVLQYAWQWRLYANPTVTLTDGRQATIIDPGQLNTNAGPDFFNAKIKIDGIEWVGNVELHIRASHWWLHHHHLDDAYSNIILHVVCIDDAQPSDKNGNLIPQLVFPLSQSIIDKYNSLTAPTSSLTIRCATLINALPRLLLTDAIQTAAYTRLKEKAAKIIGYLSLSEGDWARAAFIAVARSIGFGLNSDPLESLAKSLNLNFCARHADNIMQLEAILFGQAGLLIPPFNNDLYSQNLTQEYAFLARKYDMHPLPKEIWKMARTRPANFPFRRIAYLAHILSTSSSLLSRILDAGSDIDRLSEIFTHRFTGYWADHYQFCHTSPTASPTALSPDSTKIIIINAVAPLLSAHATLTGNRDEEETAIDILETLSPENNRYIRDWHYLGINPRSAFQSQGLLHIRRNLCDRHDCLHCRIGNKLIRQSATPATQ